MFLSVRTTKKTQAGSLKEHKGRFEVKGLLRGQSSFEGWPRFSTLFTAENDYVLWKSDGATTSAVFLLYF